MKLIIVLKIRKFNLFTKRSIETKLILHLVNGEIKQLK